MKPPKGWTVLSMNQIGEIQAGRQRSPHLVKGTMRPYLRVANVQDGWIDFSNLKEMPFTEKEAAVYQLAPGDILLSEGQSLELVGRPAIYQGEIDKCCFQNTLVRLRTREHSPDFVLHLCKYQFTRGTFQRIAKRTTSIAHLGVSRFAELSAFVPPLPEQRKIADILTTWDEALIQLDGLIEVQECRKKALMQQLLTGKRRFPAFAKKQWQKVRMSEVLERVFRPIEWSAKMSLSLVSLRRRCGGLFRRPDVLGADYKTRDLHELQADDFLVSKRQVVHGAWGLVTPEFAGTHVSKEYAILVNMAPEKLHMPFFAWLCQTPRMIHLARTASIGVHIEKLIFDSEVFLSDSISIPSDLEEQRQIAVILDTADQQLTLLRAQRIALDQQKRGLMQRLLTGRLRVKTN